MSQIVINSTVDNSRAPETISNITRWHYDRNLIDGTTDQAQFIKLLEEIIEVFMAINPGLSPEKASEELQSIIRKLSEDGKIKTDPTGETLADSIGDSNVVLINIAERNNLTMARCLATAYDGIKDRTGRMIDGVFVKEADLPENQ
tara:strand:- start:9803 stop:10240 length:438 start_codon:yes stop_codon:yes gene_type:complete